MGNCMSNKYLSGKSTSKQEALEMVQRRLLGDDGGLKSSPTITEVKIKITKGELEKLLGKKDVEELPVAQLLSRLMDVSDAFETHRRSWRPSLQSIPEVN